MKLLGKCSSFDGFLSDVLYLNKASFRKEKCPSTVSQEKACYGRTTFITPIQQLGLTPMQVLHLHRCLNMVRYFISKADICGKANLRKR